MPIIVLIVILLGATFIPWIISFSNFTKIPDGKSQFWNRFLSTLGLAVLVSILSFLPVYFQEHNPNSGQTMNLGPAFLFLGGVFSSIIMFFIAGIVALVKSSKTLKRDDLHQDILDTDL
ncbi:MAG: hypothetical protein GY810_19705 [Aureispira sp.]|nr:hypothetical protein [Aureispira sp.]